MKKTVLMLLTFCLFCSYGAEKWHLENFSKRIKLDWNKSLLKSDRCINLKIDADKLSRLTDCSSAGSGYTAVVSDRPSGFVRLPLFQNENGIFFTPPEDSTALWFYFGAEKQDNTFSLPPNDLFSGILSPEGWRIGGRNEKVYLHPEIIFPEDPSQGKIFTSNNKKAVVFSGSDVKKRHFINFFKDVKIPAGSAGACQFAIGFTSLSKMAWGMGVRLHQLDKKGRVLTTGVVDPRWLNPLTVPGKYTRISLPGRIHPEADKVRIHIALSSVPQKYDVYGRKLATDSSDALPVLEVDYLSLTKGLEMPLVPYRKDLFSDYKDNSGNHALNFDGGTSPFFSTSGQSVWAEAHVLRSQKSYSWPLADGTVEFKLNPVWSNPEQTITLIDAYEHTQHYMFRVNYQKSSKTLTLIIREFAKRGLFRWEAEDRSRIGKRHQWQVKADIPEKQWSDLAFCWGKAGVRIFHNGKKIFEDTSYHHRGAALTLQNHPDKIVPYAIALGTEVRRVRGIAPRIQPIFKGMMDELRISSKMRYKKDYVPSGRMTLDSSTLALFDFDRNLNGIRADGEKFIDGCLMTGKGARSSRITVEEKNGKSQEMIWYPETLSEKSDPRKFLDKLNYKDIPQAADFRMARREHSKSFSLKSGEKKELIITGRPYMESVEIACPADAVKPLCAPFLLNDGDIDPRSYGDLRDSLKFTENASDAYKVQTLFNMLLRSSDYFFSNQVSISADGVSRAVMYEPMTLLNSYCGFECGPLNNMAINLFANVADCPSAPADGYYHAFEQVLIDGKWSLYDLSAQTCFPSRNKRTQASLAEIEKDPALMYQFHTSPTTGASSNHFIRQWRRSYHVHLAQFPRRMDFVLNPGESFCYYWFNGGGSNVLVTDRMKENAAGDWKNVTGEQQTIGTTGRLLRSFPDNSTGVFSFNGRPVRSNPAFFNFTENSFCYQLNTPYPIVGGMYSAFSLDGKPVALEYSRNNGRDFIPLEKESLTEEIMARTRIIIRINSVPEKISNFAARTFVQLNPRLLGGGLRAGKNTLRLKADNDTSANISVKFRTDVSQIRVDGIFTSGTKKGAELKLAALEAGAVLTLPVSGVSSDAKVTATSGLTATLKKGKLEITSVPEKHLIGEVKITDRECVYEIAVISAPGCRMLTADMAKVSGKSKVFRTDEKYAMPVVKFDRSGDTANFDFAAVPAGKYLVFTLFRQPQGDRGAEGCYDVLAMTGVGNKPVIAGYVRNGTADFYKASYGTEESRIKWDYPLGKGAYPYQPQRIFEFSERSNLTFRVLYSGLIFGGALLLKSGNEEFNYRLRQLLTGINCNFWKIENKK